MKTERIIELAKADYLEDCGWVQFDNGWRHPDTEEEVYDDCAALKYENKGCGATDVVDSVCAHAIRLARLEGVKAALEAAAKDLSNNHPELMSDGSINWHHNHSKVSEMGLKAKTLHAERIRAIDPADVLNNMGG